MVLTVCIFIYFMSNDTVVLSTFPDKIVNVCGLGIGAKRHTLYADCLPRWREHQIGRPGLRHGADEEHAPVLPDDIHLPGTLPRAHARRSGTPASPLWAPFTMVPCPELVPSVTLDSDSDKNSGKLYLHS